MTLVGLLLILATWIALRVSVGARLRPLGSLVLDCSIILLGWCFVVSLTARPIVAAIVIIGLAVGLAVVDRVKRAVLREPVLFADRAELLEILRHPRLYLPFAGTGRVLAGAGAILTGFVVLLALERPIWPLSPWSPILGIAVLATLLTLSNNLRFLPHVRLLYERLSPTREPVADAARFGLLAGFVIHATLARAERAARRAGLAPRRMAVPAPPGAIVLVQSESFFDVARLDPALALPGFSCLAAGAASGRLAVPCWGANTIRTEFAVLTGLDEERLGLDRFNPYADFARVPIEGMAWRARAAGWRTICIHPFDLSFYARNRVLPMLGFETLIGPEAFIDAARGGAYVADVEIATRVAALLDAATGGLMIFAITMEGHGPWDQADPAASLALPPALAGISEADALSRFLFRLHAADNALPILTEALRRRPGRGVLALYGDHQPSLPKAFSTIGFDDERTDYLIWRSDVPGDGARRDLRASELGHAVLSAGGLGA